MQINSVNSGHDQSSHHITNCLHQHSSIQEKAGGASSGAMAENAQQIMENVDTNDNFSLSDWMKKAFGNGKRFLGSIWSGGTATVSSDVIPSPGDGEQVMVQIGDPHTSDRGQNREGNREYNLSAHSPQIAAAASVAQVPAQHGNPYFTVEASDTREHSLIEKIKVKFHSITGYMSKQFSGHDTFHAQQEPSKEDLRRHSHYRGEQEEIDCVLTDDSYLLDSYDKKGEYTKLTTKNR